MNSVWCTLLWLKRVKFRAGLRLTFQHFHPSERMAVPITMSMKRPDDRSNEQEIIIAAANRVSSSTTKAEGILIWGSNGTGTGRTRLVLDTRKQLLASTNTSSSPITWVCGRYLEQKTESRPFSGIVDALSELIYAIHLSSSFDEIEARMHSIVSLDDLLFLSDRIPAIDMFTEQQMEDEDDADDRLVESERTLPLATEEMLHRFSRLVQCVMRAICPTQKLVVMFLDDLQWADRESRELIESIILDTDLSNFLLVGTVLTGKDVPLFSLSDNTLSQITTIHLLEEEDEHQPCKALRENHSNQAISTKPSQVSLKPRLSEESKRVERRLKRPGGDRLRVFLRRCRIRVPSKTPQENDCKKAACGTIIVE